MIYEPIQRTNCRLIFELLIFLANFLNFKFRVNLWNSSSRAIETDRAVVVWEWSGQPHWSVELSRVLSCCYWSLYVFLMADKPNQSASSSKASLTSGVNGLVTLSSAVTQSSSLSVATTTTPSLLAAAASSGSLVGPSSTTTTTQVVVTTQSSFPTQAALSQQQYKLQQQQQQLELQLKQQQQQLAAAAADAETKRLFANGAPHIMQVNFTYLSYLYLQWSDLTTFCVI